MSEIAKSRVDEIVTLHNEIGCALKMTVEKAMRIGELLETIKAELKHGEFISWIEEHLPFTDRTARNYMNIFKHKERLKTETVSDLTEAYRLLEAPTVMNDTRPAIIKAAENRMIEIDTLLLDEMIDFVERKNLQDTEDSIVILFLIQKNIYNYITKRKCQLIELMATSGNYSSIQENVDDMKRYMGEMCEFNDQFYRIIKSEGYKDFIKRKPHMEQIVKELSVQNTEDGIL